jgi:cell division protein FtsQ
LEKKIYLILYRLTLVVIIYLFIKIVSPFTFDKIFPINAIDINGNYDHVEREQVLMVVEKYLEGNFFSLNIKKFKDGFEKLPWVEKVEINRSWPGKISVKVAEHTPVARYGKIGIGLVNQNGLYFHAASSQNLPFFEGPKEKLEEITNKYNSFSKILGDNIMQIRRLSLLRQTEWTLETTDGLVINIGEHNPEEKLASFMKNYQKVLAQVKKRITYVDLRYRDGFSISVDEQIKKLNNL